MTKEDIEKAAVNNCVIENSIFNPALTPYYQQGFKDGAEWRINSVWHNVSDIPEERRFCLYILKDGTYGCGYYHKEDNSIWYARFNDVVKWAYIEDLIPNTED